MSFKAASAYDCSFLPPAKVEDIGPPADVEPTDRQVRRVCALAGRLDGLPPTPAPLGGDIPDRTLKAGGYGRTDRVGVSYASRPGVRS